jgi:hypothetical protein
MFLLLSLYMMGNDRVCGVLFSEHEYYYRRLHLVKDLMTKTAQL